MKIQVYKCPWTGKIFEFSDREKYIMHLAKIKKNNREANRITNAKNTFKEWLAAEKFNIRDVSEIPPWVLKNQEYIMLAHNGFNRDHFYPETDRFEKITFGRMMYTDLASNTHRCPDNGVMNFGWNRNPDLPRGYPGYIGQIQGTLIRNQKHNGSYPVGECLNMLGLKTGSGGGGNNNWSWSVTVFMDDWPGIKENFEQQCVIDRLKGIAHA